MLLLQYDPLIRFKYYVIKRLKAGQPFQVRSRTKSKKIAVRRCNKLNRIRAAPVYFHAKLVLAGCNGELTGLAVLKGAQFGSIQQDGISPEIIRKFGGSPDSQSGHGTFSTGLRLGRFSQMGLILSSLRKMPENYFNYFTEVEEHYCRRRGTHLYVSTLDWALIETWKDAGIPLEAVLRGIDSAFDRYDRRPGKTKKINSLAFCAQEVLTAAEEMKEAAVGSSHQEPASSAGLEAEEIAKFFQQNAEKLHQAHAAKEAQLVAKECAATLTDLASTLSGATPLRLEDLERRLTVLEEKLLAALTVSATENELFELRTEADREIAPYRSKMPGAQIQQLQKQFIHKRLFEKAKIPRLSLFYL